MCRVWLTCVWKAYLRLSIIHLLSQAANPRQSVVDVTTYAPLHMNSWSCMRVLLLSSIVGPEWKFTSCAEPDGHSWIQSGTMMGCHTKLSHVQLDCSSSRLFAHLNLCLVCFTYHALPFPIWVCTGLPPPPERHKRSSQHDDPPPPHSAHPPCHPYFLST